MKLDLIDGIFEVHVPNHIICAGIDEPFLAPDRIRYIMEKGRGKQYDFLGTKAMSLAFYTNGNLVTEDIAKDILNYPGLGSVSFSFNAADDETRQEVMGIPLTPAKENYIRFLELRRELGREGDVHVSNTHIITPQTKNKQEQYKTMILEMNSGYTNVPEPGLYNPTNWGGDLNPQWTKITRRNIGTCGQWPSMAISVNVDGHIKLCCYNTRWTFGHILDPEAVASFLDRNATYGITDHTNGAQYPHLCADCDGRHETVY